MIDARLSSLRAVVVGVALGAAGFLLLSAALPVPETPARPRAHDAPRAGPPLTGFAGLFAPGASSAPADGAVSLLGVSLGDGPSRALLAVGDATPTWHAVGERVADGTLRAVRPRSIDIDRDGSTTTIHLFGGGERSE